MLSMNPFYTSHRIGQLILKRSALAPKAPFFALKRSLFAAWNAETLVEAVNAATGSHFTLLTSVERVTFATNVQVQIVTHS
ncbi:hypothetical protein A9993_16700 [Rahnella victoriana]|nr:hypothetical protein A9993_16700 [Rahnella victoriana]